MKLFKKLFSYTLLYKIYLNFVLIKEYVYDYDYVSDSLYSEAFYKILEKYLNLKVKKDWIGRIYGIINPNLDINGKLDFNNTIIEIDDNNTNSNEYVKNFIYKQMNMVKYVFDLSESGFFDYIGCDITHVGPKEHDNYLIVFYIVSQKAMLQNLKRLLKQFSIYTIIAIIAYLILKNTIYI